MADDLIEFEPGKVICGRWKVQERLGSGGCGVVYECIHTKRNKYRAAVKVLETEPANAHILL